MELLAALLAEREDARHDLVRALDDEARELLLDLALADALELRERLLVGRGVGLDLDDRLAAERAHELGGRAERDHLAVVDDRDAVAERLRLVHEVRGEEERGALLLE